RDSGAHHRREIGQIIAEIEDLIKAQREFVQHPLARIELVRRTLVQLLDAELARSTHKDGRAAAGEQSDGDAAALRELDAEAVANVEFLDFARFAGVDDLAVGPDAVDVGDDELDFVSARGHRSNPSRESPAEVPGDP